MNNLFNANSTEKVTLTRLFKSSQPFLHLQCKTVKQREVLNRENMKSIEQWNISLCHGSIKKQRRSFKLTWSKLRRRETPDKIHSRNRRKLESVGHEVNKKPQSVMGYLKIPPFHAPMVPTKSKKKEKKIISTVQVNGSSDGLTQSYYSVFQQPE